MKKQEGNWIPFEFKRDEQGREILSLPLPDDGEEILVSDGRFVWIDTFMGDESSMRYLDSNRDFEGLAWMPLPEPYKGENK